MNVKLKSDDILGVSENFRLQWEKSQNNYVLLYPEGMVKLNETAGEILHLCDKKNTIKTIIDIISAQYQNTELEKDIYIFLEESYGKGWIKHY